jgi:hypothetical protein
VLRQSRRTVQDIGARECGGEVVTDRSCATVFAALGWLRTSIEFRGSVVQRTGQVFDA